MCSHGNFSCREGIAASLARSAVMSCVLLSWLCELSAPSGARRRPKQSFGAERKMKSWNTGPISFLCVCVVFHVFITKVRVRWSCFLLAKSGQCPKADGTHEHKSIFWCCLRASVCRAQCLRWFPTSVPLQIKLTLVIKVICDHDLLLRSLWKIASYLNLRIAQTCYY